MIPKIGVDMTTDEAAKCVENMVARMGYRWVFLVALMAARKLAGQKATEAEREFAELQRIAEAAKLENPDEETGT